ncbi:kinase inhibitor [Enterobacteriaceae bacterium RIT691]|nr:kinase inhibitor [Enterobacteriaceae bacterium RIT691]
MKSKSARMAAIVSVMSFSAFAAPAFTLTSADVPDGGQLTAKQIFSGFGCRGDNRSPQLSWTNPPPGTKSFAITLYDPDAPTGSGWWHWTVVNIPATVRSIAAGAGEKGSHVLPASAIQGRNDFGYAGFGGACPPAGDKAHPYQFTVWALKTAALPIDAQSSGAMVGYMLHSNVIAKAQLISHYAR